MTTSPVLTVFLFSQKHPSFTVGSLRQLIHRCEKNGLGKSGAIIRLGSRVLIHETKFFEWLEDQNNISAA